MSELQVASRYAKSLIDLAQEENALEPVKLNIEAFIHDCKANPQLLAVLKNPIVSPSKKIAILNQLYGGTFHKVVMAYFKIVTAKMRSAILYATAKEFISEYNLRKGIVKAFVCSAVPLSDANKAEIIAKVKETVKGEVILEAKVNPALVGGFILQVGDRQFDASISSSLRKLKKEFANTVFS